MNRKYYFILLSVATLLFHCADSTGSRPNPAKTKESDDYSIISNLAIMFSEVTDDVKESTKRSHNPQVNIEQARGALKNHIFPILQEIESRPVHCSSIIDDPDALKDLQDIRAKNNATNSSQFFDDQMKDSIERETFTAELEERLQKRTEGQITYAFPNVSTLRALAKIHSTYPCAEAAIVSLLEIPSIIWQPGHLYINEQSEGEWRDMENAFLQYIISSYPNKWESQIAEYRMNIRKPQDALDRIEINKQLIRYMENNDTLTHKYFILYMSRIDSGGNYIVTMYGMNTQQYFYLGSRAGTESIKDTGKLNKESIDLCQKGFDTFDEALRKYPNARDLKSYVNMAPEQRRKLMLGAEKCYNIIHRLEEFKDK